MGDMSEHKFLLRVPVVMWDELRVAAGRNRRSINSEILWRLSGSGSVVGSGSENPTVRGVVDEPLVVRDTVTISRIEGFRPDFKGGKK